MEEQEARLAILNTALGYLEKLSQEAKTEHTHIYDDLTRHYRARATLLQGGGEKKKKHQAELALARYERNLTGELHALERATAVSLRNEDKINDELLRIIERELDLDEARLQDL
jgi:hypothetical protein